jgi:hypothetical protein
VMLYVTCAGGVGMALLYLLTPNLLPFHLRYLGHSQAELDSQAVSLLLFAFRIIGGCFLAIHLSVAILVAGGATRATTGRRAVLLLLVVSYLPTLRVAVEIGGPWWLFLLGIALAGSAFVLSEEPGSTRP